MKIRTGFVSNSSSSSFLIFGAYFSYDDEEYKKVKEALDGEFWDDEEITRGQCRDYFYVGIDPTTLGDTETGRDFKNRAVAKVNNFLKKYGIEKAVSVENCSWHEESWYDG